MKNIADMRLFFLAVFIQLLFIKNLSAQEIFAVKDSKLPYQFWVHYPDGYKENPNKKYPLLVFLHGRSLSGTNLELVKNYGVIYEILRGMKIDFIVVAPQCQNGWDNSKLIKVLDYAENTYRVDKSRVYLTGMSMGGYGAWYFAGGYPDRFAAVAPVCGGGKVSDAQNLKDLPHWVHHGALDKPVPISESEKMVSAIKAAGNKRVEFTVYKNYGHGELVEVFRNPKLYEWFLKYRIEKAIVNEEPLLAVNEPEPVKNYNINTSNKKSNDEVRELKPQISSNDNTNNKPNPVEKKEEFIVFEEPVKKEETKASASYKTSGQYRPTLVQRKPEEEKKEKHKIGKQIDKIRDWEIWEKLK